MIEDRICNKFIELNSNNQIMRAFNQREKEEEKEKRYPRRYIGKNL